MADFLKFSGAILLIGASSWLGFFEARILTERCRILQAWLRILEILGTEISYQARMLPEVFRKVALLADEPVFVNVFTYLASRLDYGTGFTVAELWEELLAKQSRVLHHNDLLILGELGNYLGTTDRQDQLEKLQLCQARLTQNLESAKDKRDRQVGIYRYLGFAAGSIIVLWLL